MFIQNLTLILHLDYSWSLDRWKKKITIYLKDKYKHDGGKVYWNRPIVCLTQSKDKVKKFIKTNMSERLKN